MTNGAKPRGGARIGAGRKAAEVIEGEPVTKFSVSLDAASVTSLRDLGDGNLSAGIRKLARLIKKPPV
jgi:carbon monoxide dehydrogenase subunit G